MEEQVKSSDFIFRTFVESFWRRLVGKFQGQRFGFCPADAGSGTGAAVDERLGPPALRTPPFARKFALEHSWEQGRLFGQKRHLPSPSPRELPREELRAQKLAQTPPIPVQKRSLVPALTPAIGRGSRGFGHQLRSLPGSFARKAAQKLAREPVREHFRSFAREAALEHCRARSRGPEPPRRLGRGRALGLGGRLTARLVFGRYFGKKAFRLKGFIA